MGIDTNLNTAPYFDDFDVDKNFHQVLFKPRVAVQARELTQLQTILQNQIERFGENILKQGTLIKGGNFVEHTNYHYVKIEDNNTEGQPVALNNYLNLFAKGQSTGVIAKISFVVPGLESQSPNLNTIYVEYLNSSNGNKTFQAGEVLDLYETFENSTLSDRYTEELQNGTVINASLTVATTAIDSNPIGVGYATSVDEGIIFQKGYFIRFDPQRTIVSKYTNRPTGIVVGFKTSEELINSFNDTSLLDNAEGFNNENAPGADRLKLTPELVAYTLAEAEADENFFAISEYNNGRLVRRNDSTQFNTVEKLIENRTMEESGNYTVEKFGFDVKRNFANNEIVDLNIGKGIAYVEGKRVETVGSSSLRIRQGSDFESVDSQEILGSYGNYIEVESVIGSFDFDTPVKIDLYDTVQNATTLTGLSLSGSKIGEAFVRGFTRDPFSSDRFRLYIFNVNMNSGKSFRDVRSVYYNSTVDAVGDVVLVNGNAKIKENTSLGLVFPIGKDSIKTIDSTSSRYPYRVKESATANTNGDISITVGTSHVLPQTQSNEIFVVVTDGTNRPTGVEHGEILYPTNVNYTSNTSMIVTVDNTGLSNTMSVDVYYNVRKSSAAPAGKTLDTVYVKIDGNTYPNFAKGTISLGMPDVYEILGIWRGSGTNYSESNKDVTSGFTLVRNDTDSYYGHSFIKRRNNVGLNDTLNLLIKCRVFRKNTSGSFGDGFFNVNSYPIDDANTANTQAISTEEIPQFTNITGQTLDLRDCLDFRPYVSNNVVYSSTIAGATVRGAGDSVEDDYNSISFTGSDLQLIAPNNSFFTDYEYYLGRMDRVFIDEKGNFSMIEGDPSEEPVSPNEPQKGMSLALISVPPFPSLPKNEANPLGKRHYAIGVKPISTPGYKMSDIQGLFQRIERLEYYTVLNALEQKSKDLVITDSSGNDRFKNGIIVDNFNDFTVSNLKSDEYSASVNKSKDVLEPKFRKYSLNLVPVAGGTEQLNNSLDNSVLQFNNKTMIDQPYATNFKSCTTQLYRYKGSVNIHPDFDAEPDVTKAPEINVEIDTGTDFSESLSEFLDLTQTDVSTETETDVSSVSGTGGTTTTTTTTTTTRTDTTELVIGSETNTQKVGDFVTDTSFSPYMRGNDINIKVDGLRPNTRFYFFFDGVDVNQYVCPADRPEDENGDPVGNIKDFVKTGKYGAEIYSGGAGKVKAIFSIPDNTFLVGDRKLQIVDVDSLDSLDAATSTAEVIYSAYNFSYETTSLEITTRTPTADTLRSSDTTSTSTSTSTFTSGTIDTGTTAENNDDDANFGTAAGEYNDPISQTFYVSPEFSNDNAIQLNKLDLFFKEKSTTNGVTVQIRRVQNGFPTKTVIPFASTHLDPDEINISEDGTVKTEIKFPGNISLKTDTEYAITVIPDANDPNYRIWIAKTGLIDIASGVAITQDANRGVLFTSTNNSAWTPYQDENLKYKIYMHEYTVPEGYIRLTNDDTEFFTCNSYSGTFERSENVFIESSNANGSISVTTSSKRVTGSGTTFTTDATIGEHIIMETTSGNYEVGKIERIVSDTKLDIDITPSNANTSANYFISPVGVMDYWNTRDSVRLVLEKSTAKNNNFKFSNGDTVRGERSNATAVIESVDDVAISTIQPNIFRNNFTTTSTRLSAITLTNSAGSNYLSNPIKLDFKKFTNLNKTETYIRSKSNELSSGNSFELQVDLKNFSNSTRDTSPIIDYEISTVNVKEYLINNDVTNEDSNEIGNADSKYVSKTIELADGLDAEDLRVWLTAYRPRNTDITVYAKFKNAEDPISIENIPWTKLELEGRTNYFSSSANLSDYKEMEFYLGDSAGDSNGDAVAGQGAVIENPNNSVTRTFKYISSDGVVYTDYKYFTIKIVLTSTGKNAIPRVKDMRGISLT